MDDVMNFETKPVIFTTLTPTPLEKLTILAN